MKTRYITAIAAAALMLCGCQRESLAPEFGAKYDGKISYAPGVAGIGSANGGVKSGLSDGSAVTGSLTLSSADGRFSIPMGLSVTGAETAGATSGARTRASLINENGGITAAQFADAISDTFMVAAWNIPDVGDPIQCIPDDSAKTFTGCVSASKEYQKVMYRDSTLSGKYWMTVQPQKYPDIAAAKDKEYADDEYIWKESEIKTFYAYANVPAGDTVSLLAEGAGQTLTCSGVPTQDILMGYYSGPGTTGGKNTGTAGIQFRHPLAAVKFKTGTLASGVTIRSVAIENVYGKGDLMVEQLDSLFTWKRKDGDAFKDANMLSEVDAACDGDAVLVIPQSFPPKARIRVTIEQDGEPEPFNVYTPLTGSWLADTLYTYTIGYNPTSEDPNLLPGKFSVSATKYVQFSRGNLQANIDASGSPVKWKFAEHQYDIIGNGGANVTIGTAAGDMDLFGWSASSGYAYGISKSTTDADYSGDFVDWGQVFAAGEKWSTMSSDDWNYLLNTRTGSTLFETPNARYIKCTIGTNTGIMLFPDEFEWPASVTTHPDKENINLTNSNFSYTCSAEEFKDLEAAGAVFLPVSASAIYREGNTVNSHTYSSGQYWTSTLSSTTTNAYSFSLSSGEVKTNGKARHYGHYVRLVQKSPKPHGAVLIGDLYWATTNIGANTPQEYGWFFSWGNTTGYVWWGSNWVTAEGGETLSGDFSATSYKETPGYSLTANITPDGGNDAARIHWGGQWRMPTQTEMNDMIEATYWAWDATDGGYYVFLPENAPGKSKNTMGNSMSGVDKDKASLFLPAAGYGGWNNPGNVERYGQKGYRGYYWSSTYYNANEAGRVIFEAQAKSRAQSTVSRYLGFPIRPVMDAE